MYLRAAEAAMNHVFALLLMLSPCRVTDHTFGWLEPARPRRILGRWIRPAVPEVWHEPMKRIECNHGLFWGWIPESDPVPLSWPPLRLHSQS
jgi:hypothetical protein